MHPSKRHSATSPRFSRRKKPTVLILLLAALAIVFSLWPKKPHVITKDTTVTADPEPAEAPPSTPARIVPNPAPTAAADPGTPVIDEVTIEKKEVCQGEDNMITVRAHTENGTDAFLNYVIDGKRGTSVPLRLLAANGKIIGEHSIEVFGKNKAVTTIPVPAFKVKDCKAPYLAEVQAKLQPNTWGIYDFVATVGPFRGLMALPKPPPPFVPVRYEWTFGDGEKATTTVPTVTHSYEGREQNSQFSYMNVSVKIHSELGDTAVARTSLALANPAFEALAQKGIVTLLISLDPRFPEMDEQGQVVQHVRLWHSSPQPVTIESVAVTRYYAENMRSWESHPESVGVGTLLGTTTIPPGKDGVLVTVVLDTSADADLFSATYRLAGKSAKGEPVMGSFSVMRPPPHPKASKTPPPPQAQREQYSAPHRSGSLGQDPQRARDPRQRRGQ